MMSKAELLDRLDELLAQALRGGIDPLYANRVLMDKASEMAETATLIRARVKAKASAAGMPSC